VTLCHWGTVFPVFKLNVFSSLSREYDFELSALEDEGSVFLQNNGYTPAHRYTVTFQKT
jgi:hypothetical protein